MIQKYKLNELGSVSRGKSKHRPRNDPKLYGGKYPFIQTGDVKHSPFYVTSHSQTYNEKGLEQSKLWDAGTLCITIAANIAETAILSYPACFPDSIIGFVPDSNKADVKFIKYCLDTYKLQMQSISQGTTQDNMSLEKLLSISFIVPELEIQKKIAAILSAYDDLIENNKRRIALLENMAEEIYREWFVRFRFPGYQQAKFEKGIPLGWNLKKIEQLCTTVTDGSHSSPPFFEGGRYMASVKDMRSNSFALDSMKTISEKDFAHLVKGNCQPLQNDILIAKDGSYLKHVFVWKEEYDLVVLSSIAILRPNLQVISPHFFSLILKQESTKSMMSGYVSGSALPRIILKDFKKMRLLIPEYTLMINFEKIIEPIYSQIQALNKKIIVLEQTRNKLLGRLISGKLSVENLDIEFPPSML